MNNFFNKLVGTGLLLASVIFAANVRSVGSPAPAIFFGIIGLLMFSGKEKKQAPSLEEQQRIAALEAKLADMQHELDAHNSQLSLLNEDRDFMRQLADPNRAKHTQS